MSCSRATTAEKCTKKRDARAKLLFCLSKPIAFCRSRCRRRRRYVNSLIRPPWRHVKTLYSKAGYKDLTEPKVHAASHQLKSHTNSFVAGLSFLVFNGHPWVRYGFQQYSVLKYDMFSDCVLLHDSSSRFPAVRAKNLSLTSQLTAESRFNQEIPGTRLPRRETLFFFHSYLHFIFSPIGFPLVGTRSQLWLRADGP